jgi:hypothetical protein
VYPQQLRRKRQLLAILALVALLAGCGGGGTKAREGQQVVGEGFRFSAPTGWHVSHMPRAVTISPGNGPTLASVTVLTLRSRYRPALFTKVAAELDRLTTSLASKLHGKVIARRTIAVAGIQSRQYDLAYERDGSGLVDRITFVLRGTREYYVLCRWPADEGEPAACGQLVATFELR